MSAFIREMWSWYAVTWVVTIMRMVSRTLLLGSVKKWQIEDFLQLFAMFTDTVIMVGMSILSRTGTNLFDPKLDIVLTPEEVENRELGSKMILVVECMQCLTIWVIKCCLLIMLHRITLSTRQNLAVKIVAVYVISGFVVMMILYLGYWCRPFSGYWKVPQSNPECNASPSHLILNAVLNISSDIMIIIIPMPLMIKSKLPLKRKLILCCIFALGTFTILSAVLNKLYSFRDPYGEHWTYWYVRESSTALITVNLPYIWPLLRRAFNLKSFDESSNRRTTNKSTTHQFQSSASRNHRSATRGHPDDLDLERSDSQERINAVPLKIYQSHQVEITSEQVSVDDSSHSPRRFDNGNLSTTIVTINGRNRAHGSRDEETGSERSVGGVVKAFDGV